MAARTWGAPGCPPTLTQGQQTPPNPPAFPLQSCSAWPQGSWGWRRLFLCPRPRWRTSSPVSAEGVPSPPSCTPGGQVTNRGTALCPHRTEGAEGEASPTAPRCPEEKPACAQEAARAAAGESCGQQSSLTLVHLLGPLHLQSGAARRLSAPGADPTSLAPCSAPLTFTRFMFLPSRKRGLAPAQPCVCPREGRPCPPAAPPPPAAAGGPRPTAPAPPEPRRAPAARAPPHGPSPSQ